MFRFYFVSLHKSIIVFMAKPFLKWVGGKTQLLDDIIPLIDRKTYNKDSFIYVEPFVGGGSVLFNVIENFPNLKYAVINDLNTDLMDCYRVLAWNIDSYDMYGKFKEELYRLQKEYNNKPTKATYEAFRDTYNKEREIMPLHVKCAYFVALNKLCFNGIYRVNRKGEFNVPWNQKKSVNLFDEDILDRCRMLIRDKVVVMNNDYFDTFVATEFARVQNCDILYYMDPPYRPVSETSNFVDYTKDGFDDREQERLQKLCSKIDYFGGDFIVSNSKSGNFFENLYSNYNIDYIKARRNVNSKGDGRGKVDEILIYNGEKTSKCVELF